MLPPYVSRVEQAIRSSNQPIQPESTEMIEVNGQRGVWVNKAEVENWQGEIPISSYLINVDPNPEIVTLRYANCTERIQQLSLKYLRPPKPAPPGPIVIKQQANFPTPPAPPIIIRQIPDLPCNPPPVTVREAPPPPPQPIPAKEIVIPGERIPPPPRRVIIERLAPQPPQAQPISVERWLPYEKRERQVVLEPKPCDPCVEKPKNVVVEWEPQCVNPSTQLTVLDTTDADPVSYAQQNGSTLVSASSLPQFALNAPPPQSLEPTTQVDLVGDVHGLRLINLEKEGLSQYSSLVR